MCLTLLAEKNPAFKDRYTNVTGFDVASPPGKSGASEYPLSRSRAMDSRE